jgi:hypothetical protein
MKGWNVYSTTPITKVHFWKDIGVIYFECEPIHRKKTEKVGGEKG